MNYEAPSEITKILADHGLALKKRFGQNFLINRQAREKIVAGLETIPGELVWEIGPGLGAMTELLLERPGRLVLFEIDRGLVRILRELFAAHGNVFIMEGDAVRTLAAARAKYGTPARVLGNLPYSSASQIVAALINDGVSAKKVVVTVQKELALRMRALPREKNYSSFSVLCQSFFKVKHEFDLKGGNFFPRPAVDSSVVSLVPVSPAPEGAERDCFFKLIRLAFGARRKTLANNLLKTEALPPGQRDALRDYWMGQGWSDKLRAEELPPSAYQALARVLTRGAQA